MYVCSNVILSISYAGFGCVVIGCEKSAVLAKQKLIRQFLSYLYEVSGCEEIILFGLLVNIS